VLKFCGEIVEIVCMLSCRVVGRFRRRVVVDFILRKHKPLRVLAIETSSSRGSVALLQGEEVLCEKCLGEGSRHGRDLVPAVDEVLGGDSNGADLLAVSAGPGSFTGLRIGITFAKMLALETETPLVTVSSLDAIAANLADAGPLCVAVDARLGRVYAAVYDGDGHKVLGDVVLRPEEVAGCLASGETRIVGDGIRRYREVLASAGRLVEDEELWYPRAAQVGRLGLVAYNEKGGENPRAVLPRYLERSQAEVKWEQSQNASGPK
jgi:tRNA threonylcarbamoyladenosine biosynthesis protein TsaB